MKKHFIKVTALLFLIGLFSCHPNKPANNGERGDGAVPDKELDPPAGDSTVSNNPRQLKDSVEIISKGNAAKK
jgi:hypothetical protein